MHSKLFADGRRCLEANYYYYYSHYTGQPALAGYWELEDFVGANFCCPRALADVTTALGLGRRR